MRLLLGEDRGDYLLDLAVNDKYCMVLCVDVKRANVYKRAGVPKERVFTPSTIKDRSKGIFIAPPNYLIADDADLLLGYYTGQPVGIMAMDAADVEEVG